MTYSDGDIGTLDESTLRIYRYDGSNWNALTGCTVDTSANTLTCATSSFSDFAIFGEEGTCATVEHASTYNAYPTCGPATCDAGYILSNVTCVSAGGGGLIWIYPQALTAVGTSVAPALDFSINNNATIATSPVLAIGMNANPQTVRYFVLSLDPTFAKNGLVPYASSTTFTLPNVPGNYTLYLKYYSPTGNYSSLISHSIQYVPSTPNTSSTACIHYKYTFIRDLKFGMAGDDVRELQKYLNDHGSQLVNQGFGSPGNETIYFVNRTLSALARFQVNNNLQPTGKLDAGTRAFIKCSDKTRVSTSIPVFIFTRDLQFGEIDADVKELQKYLNNHSFKLAEQGAGALGFETNYFGSLTQKALAEYQKANNIIPANGYFGPITRNFINNN
jgi:peptidoglycan hydrolase-like protein with peptidoglycan-binding domain